MKALLPLLTVLTAALASASSALAADYPPGFEDRTMIGGLTRPTVVDWTPDGRTVVAEKDGVLKVAAPGSLTAETVLDIRSIVNSGSDRGLLGMAVDSAFESNRYVYLLYTYELSPMVSPDGLGPMVSQLLRVKLNPDNSVTEQQVLLGSYTAGPCPTPQNDLDCIPSDGDSHSIGTVISAPDGTLFVSSGDAASYNEVDDRAFRSYDEQSLAGKIMHVDRNGNGLSGHPFCPANADLDDVCTKLWAKGFRNPFRFALGNGDDLIVGDVGWGRHEEINLVTQGGGSYGWPCREGNTSTNGYGSFTQCQSIPPQIGPMYTYPHPQSGGAAVMGGPIYEGEEYPSEYHGSIFFGDFARAVMERLSGTASAPVKHDVADDWSGNVFLGEAPDNGDIVYVGFGDGSPGKGYVARLAYSPGNTRPDAVATVDPEFLPDPPFAFQFDGTGSFDEDGDDLSYEWDFGDGDHSSAVSPNHVYDAEGTYLVTLTVDDGRGKTDTDVVTVTAGNSPPGPPTIDHPLNYRGGGAIELAGSATDPEDGPLDPATDFSWTVRLIHGTHTHQFFDDRQQATVAFDDPATHDADSYYEVVLTVRDSGGLTASRTVRIDPDTTIITLASDPPGAQLSYYDASFAAPLTRTTTIGFKTTVGAAERLMFAGREYVFSSWSDGGPRSHAITVPEVPSALTARYLPAHPHSPPHGPPSPPKPPSAKGPKLSFDPSSGLGRSREVLKGRASDPDGVSRVHGALYRRTAKGRCRFWSSARERLTRPRSCARPVWLRAKLSGPATKRAWRLKLGAPLPPGAYRLRLRAHDAKGARATAIGNGPSVRLLVPAG